MIDWQQALASQSVVGNPSGAARKPARTPPARDESELAGSAHGMTARDTSDLMLSEYSIAVR
jgi:hypothetical protein